MTADEPLRRTEQYEVAEVDGDLLLYDGTTLQLLSGPAATVWTLVDGHRSQNEIIGEVSRRHPGGEGQVATDVAKFLFDLEIRGMVERVPALKVQYSLADPVGWTRDGNEVLLIHLADGRRPLLTVTGAQVWESVVASDDLDSCLVRVRAAYPDAPDDLAEQVVALLEQLVDAGFLRRTGQD